MHKAIVIKGRLVGPKSVELDEAVTNAKGEVQVIVPMGTDGASPQVESVFDFLHRGSAGNRSREDIDKQIREEREGWGNGH
jgi:hypothetical protein